MVTKLLLTGPAGFIASHFVEHILKNTDWEIIGIDGLSYAADASRLTDSEAFDRARISLHYWDLRAPIPDHLAERIGPVDHVINMASNSHVDNSIADPAPFILNNVQLILNMLEYARQAKPKSFIQVSTDEVYGPAPDGYAYKEWDRHLPSNPYAASKSAQEQIAVSYWRTFGVPLIVTNTMNNFGERQHREKYVPRCIANFLQGKPVQVHGQRLPDGTWKPGSRVWLHSRNFADGLLFILRNVQPVLYPAADKPERFNIAGDRELTNLQVAQMVADALGVETHIEWVDYHSCRPGHDRRYALDGSKLRQLGWTPPIDLDESFRRCVAWERRRFQEKSG